MRCDRVSLCRPRAGYRLLVLHPTLYHPFAWVVMGSGGLMGLAFAFMWVMSMYQLWFSRPPVAVTLRTDRGATPIG